MITTNGSKEPKNTHFYKMRMVSNGLETGESGESGESVYGQLLTTVWHRRFWFLAVFLGVLSVAIPIALKKEPVYQSSFRLLVEPNYKNEKQEEIAFTDSAVEIDYTTQLQLMRTSELVQRAVDRLKKDYPLISIDEIKTSLILSQVKEGESASKIFEAVYTDGDPVKSEKVLEAIKSVYQQYNLEQQAKRLNDGLSFINQQLTVERLSLLKAEETLKQFRTKHQLIDPDLEATSVATALKDIEQQRELLKAQYQENQARYADLGQNLGRSPQKALISTRLSQSSRYQKLLEKIQEIDLSLAEQRTKFTDAYPTIEPLLEQKRELEDLLKQEAKQVLGTDLNQLKLEQELLQTGQISEFDQTKTVELSNTQLILLGLQAREQILAQNEQKLRMRLSLFPELIAEYNSLKQEVEVKRGTLQQLLEAKQALGIELNRGGFNWQVVEPPRRGDKVGPNTKKDLLLSAVVAAFLAGIAVFLREAIDNTVRTTEQLKEQRCCPLIGILPEWTLSSSNRPFLWQLLRKTEPLPLPVFQWRPFREALDLIYQNIQLFNVGSNLSSLVVTSAREGEGKSTLTLGLAFSASRLHQKVLVIDANLRHPSLHECLGLPNQQGLSSLLADKTEMPIIHTFFWLGVSIDVMTTGIVPEDPVRLLGSQQMRELIKSFEQIYDLVLLDTSALLGVVDAIQVASYTRGVITISRLEQVTKLELAQASEVVNQLNVIGMVANGAKVPKQPTPLFPTTVTLANEKN